MSTRIKLKHGWKFKKIHLDTKESPEQYQQDNLSDIALVDQSFHEVTIPHDWLIWDVHNLYEDSVGIYCTSIEVPKHKDCVFLRFEGVYMDASVYVNGVKACQWKYGYTTFETNITELIQVGKNDIIVKVMHQSPNSRWYSGAGIYRPVWLIYRNLDHIAADGIYIHNKKTKRGYCTEIETQTVLTDDKCNYKLFYSILDSKGNRVAAAETAISETAYLQIDHPEEWSLEQPTLYKVYTSLYKNGRLMDEEETIIGFREVTFTTDHGLFLNGKHVKMNGVCLHHDLGCLGSAVNKCALRRQLMILKEMGVNAIRTAHNMPAVDLLELTDEMGFLVQDESFDCWRKGKTEYDYGRFFDTWAERDVENWIKRDRNHPSIVMWCIGNEIYDTHADERGRETMIQLMKWVAVYDSKKNARPTLGTNFMPWENTQKCADVIKLIGYNYAEKYYEEHHKKHPDWIIYGSETSSIVQSRGIYHFPYNKEILADDDEQCSSLGNSITSWGAPSTEYCITKERDTEYSLGQFLWSGFDYIGEPTPYHTRNSYFGQIDTAGFPKDVFYLYQAGWTDYRLKPMVHIYPYWDFNEGQIIDVRVCSNAPVIELFQDGFSLGKKEIDHSHGSRLSGEWRIPYRKGVLKACAYDENNVLLACDEKHSFTEAVKIQITLDSKEIAAKEEALVFATITMLDKDNHTVENANNRVKVSVQGAGVLVGLDNGDSTDVDQYRTDSKRLFVGKLLAVVQSDGTAGEIQLIVSAEGMQDVQIICIAKSCKDTIDQATGITAYTLLTNDNKFTHEIPVRKIELLAEEGTVFDVKHMKLVVSAAVYPQNATNQSLEWRVTDDTGVDATFATIEKDETDLSKAIVTARGDGYCRVRCMCKNGKEQYDIMSQLEMKAEGLGKLNLNPYEFLSASLFTQKGGDIGNGNERGISTSRDGKSWVSYENLDFGAFGTDEVELSIFPFGFMEFTFWKGIPYEKGSCIIGRQNNKLPSIWNTYQTEPFYLDNRLMGIQTFSIELEQKTHIKGFSFTKQLRAFSTLWAGMADNIYGDSFIIEGMQVNKIGNNVSLVFENMDFGKVGIREIEIFGYTPNKQNSIQILFESMGEKAAELIEFPHTNDKEQLSFFIKKKMNIQKVTFIFLPGCAFDFSWFKFKH